MVLAFSKYTHIVTFSFFTSTTNKWTVLYTKVLCFKVSFNVFSQIHCKIYCETWLLPCGFWVVMAMYLVRIPKKTQITLKYILQRCKTLFLAYVIGLT